MEVDVVSFLLVFVFAWYCSDEFFLNEMVSNKLVNMILEVFFPPAQRKHLDNVFQLLKVLPSIFFLLNHIYSWLGIHSL